MTAALHCMFFVLLLHLQCFCFELVLPAGSNTKTHNCSQRLACIRTVLYNLILYWLIIVSENHLMICHRAAKVFEKSVDTTRYQQFFYT